MIDSLRNQSAFSLPDYVWHESYDDPTAVRDIMESLPADVADCGYSAEDEIKLFEHMNCLRHLAKKHVGSQCVEGLIAQAHSSRDKLIMANIGLAVSTAQKFLHSRIPLEDLVADARIALIKATDHFDCHRGFRFSTYAVTTIRRQLIRKIQRHHRYLKKVFSSEKEVLEQTIAEDSLQECSMVAAAIARDSISVLNDSDRELIERRFGLKQHKSLSLRELGIEYGVSGERIRQRLIAIFQQLREHLNHQSEIADWKIAT